MLKKLLSSSLLALAVLTLGAARPAPHRLAVAAAADLQGALDEVLTTYRAQHPGVTVTVSYAASGTLARQLGEKAPFDVFLSADPDYPRQLQKKGLVAAGGLFDYAVGRLVVWVPKSSRLDFTKDGLKALAAPSVKKIALANPRHAPYGRAAEAALRKEGLYDQLASRLVFGENVAQAAQYARTGAADAGLIADSQAHSKAMTTSGRTWAVPVADYPPLVQTGAIMATAADPQAAKDLKDLLLSAKGEATLARYGFTAPRS